MSSRLLDELPELVTVPEFSAVLRIGRSAAYELVGALDRGGQLEVVRIGRLIRIRRSSLERLVRGETERPVLRAVK